jgi:tripartite-type tricarboxylate transporter receptor subunit TctC
MRRRDFLRFALAGGSVAIGSAKAQNTPSAPSAPNAQTPWPAHTARFIVPFAAGGALDIPARLIADRLSRDLAASFIVENRPGAGGAIGAQAVAQWAPDGGGLLFTSSSVAILPSLRAHLGFDPQHDLAPLSVVCDLPTGLLVSAKSRFTSAQHVIAEARANPGKLTYGSGGVGSSNHLAGASFASTAGIKLLHVPYRGAAPVLNAIYAGQIDMMFAPTLETLGYVQQHALRILGVATPQRVPALPDVPALAETLPGFEAVAWFGIVAPPGTPAPIAAKLSAAVKEALALPQVQKRLADLSADPMGLTPAETAEFMKQETERWAGVIRAAGVKLD